MKNGVVDDQTFLIGGRVQLHVGRDERDRRLAAMEFEGNGQWDGVVSKEVVSVGESGGISSQRRRDLRDAIIQADVGLELLQRGRGRPGRQAPAPAAAGRRGVSSPSVIRAMSIKWPEPGTARDWTQAMPVSWIERLTIALVSRKNRITVVRESPSPAAVRPKCGSG